ncbi:MAG TPA: alpha/beta hydrolase [Candidatus Paceibacterota bacterium]|nr:alpha/beta hydrolase [Candidatus Paceibacterota bacterium]
MLMEKYRFENEAQEPSFEEQFKKREKIETDGGTVETVDINPNAEGAPFLMAPAWGCTMNVYEPAIETLSKGRGWDDEDGIETPGAKDDETKNRVISLDYARFGGSGVYPEKTAQETFRKYSEGESKEEAEKTEKEIERLIKESPEEFIRESMAILGVLENKGIESIDVIAHSASAISVVLAALVNPEKFKSITLFGGAGLKGNDTFTRLVKGFAGQFKGRAGTPSMSTIPVTETEKKVGAVAQKEGAKYWINPYRALMEGIAISKSNSQIHEVLRILHKKGVSICVIAGVDDPVFPMKDIQKIVKADMLDGFLSVRGGHGAIGEHPELYIEAIKGLVKSMDRKREKKILENNPAA